MGGGGEPSIKWTGTPNVPGARLVPGKHPGRGVCGAAAPQEHLFRGVGVSGGREPPREKLKTKNAHCLPVGIGFGATVITKPFQFIAFGDLHGPKPYIFIGCRRALMSVDTLEGRWGRGGRSPGMGLK